MGTNYKLAQSVDALCDLIDREALLQGDDANQLLFEIARHCRSRRLGGIGKAGFSKVVEREAQMAIEVVEKHFGVSRKFLLSRARPHRICMARNAAFLILRTHTDASLTEIADAFYRDHGTVMHGCKSIAQWIDTEPITRTMYETAEREFLERAGVQGLGKGKAVGK